MSTISVVINVCNEGHLLSDCLESIKWADEIVIVDMYSTDGSEIIYQKYNPKVYYYPRQIIVELAQNFGFAQATGKWVLKLDPDERVSPALQATIRQIVVSDVDVAAYRLPFKDMMFDRWIRYTGWQLNRTVGLVRLFRRDRVRWVPEVHSTPQIDGPIASITYDGETDNAVLHLNYTSLTQFVEKLNRYTSAEAERLYNRGRPFRWYKLFYQPGREFLRRYVQYQGYRDGLVGLILSLLQTFYVMISYMKLWELEMQRREKHTASDEPHLGSPEANTDRVS